MLLLIADDDRDTAETLATLLQLRLPPPIEIVIAFDGADALAAATASGEQPRLVIMDIEMPRMNGLDAAIAMRKVLGANAPTLIAVTGLSDLAGLAAVRSVFDHIFQKPLNLDELLKVLLSL